MWIACKDKMEQEQRNYANMMEQLRYCLANCKPEQKKYYDEVWEYAIRGELHPGSPAGFPPPSQEK